MNGSLRYYNKQKAPRWLRAVGLQLPEANTIKRLNKSVVTDVEIVKAGPGSQGRETDCRGAVTAIVTADQLYGCNRASVDEDCPGAMQFQGYTGKVTAKVSVRRRQGRVKPRSDE